MYRLFPRGWTEVRRLADIAQYTKEKVGLSDDELLQEFHSVAVNLGAIPGWHRVASLATVAPMVMTRRFGNKAGTLQRYREWLQKNQPESPLLQLLPSRSRDGVGTAA